MISNNSQLSSYVNGFYSSPIKDSLFPTTPMLPSPNIEKPLVLDSQHPLMASTWFAVPTPLVYPSMPMMCGLINPIALPTMTPLSSSPNLLHLNSSTSGRNHTEPLYEWMKQHEKDPYPTKKEKEQLARICGMTARQIEHWFANARRRLKKMNSCKKLCSASSPTDSLSSNDREDTPSDSSPVTVRLVEKKMNGKENEEKKEKSKSNTVRIWSIASTLE